MRQGPQTLSATICKDCVDIISKRHAVRLMSDAYGNGIVRRQVEHTNLRACTKPYQVTAAESSVTCLFTASYCNAYLAFIEHLNDNASQDEQQFVAEVDTRDKRHRKVTVRDVAAFDGQRPHDEAVWYLSPYEFVSDWEVVMISYPQTVRDMCKPCHHVNLIHEGREKKIFL